MRVLIADDSRSYRVILRQILEKQCLEVIEVSDGVAAFQALTSEDPPELAILDWSMPGMTGPEICRAVRSLDESSPYTYLFLLTARDRVEDLAAGLDSGADDYLTKPFERQELEARIMVGQRSVRLHEALAEARRVLWEKSVKDDLTRVWNRRGIQENLESHAADHDQLSLIMMDIDHFKQVNDRYGHPVGDVVLQVVARRLQQALRESDEVGRFGGEEFLILLPGTNHEEAVSVAERLRRTIECEPVQTLEASISVTGSFGVATAHRNEVISTSSLLSAADAAMYRAKHNGRNRVESEEHMADESYFWELALA